MVVASASAFTDMLEAQLRESPLRGHMAGYHHWIRGVYLITAVTADVDEPLELPISSESTLDRVRSQLGDNLEIKVQGKTLKLVAAGSLSGKEPNELAEALHALIVPCTIVLISKNPSSFGTNTIYLVTAVTLPTNTTVLCRR